MKKLSALILVCAGLVSQICFAEESTVELPIVEKARVFYQDTAKLPYVANFYTKTSQQSVIAFYQDQLGKIVSQETKRGRLTLTFIKNEMNYRVVISEQNNLRQVDIIAQ